MKIAIMVPTRNRETQLLNLLKELGQQFRNFVDHEFSIFVVNTSDFDYSEINLDFSDTLYYYHQPSIGYVIPRNLLLSKLDDSFDVGIFIDDDEYPSSDWLSELLRPISNEGVVAVTGPVLPDFEAYMGWMCKIPLYYHNVNSKSEFTNILGGNVALNLSRIFPVLGKNLFDMRFNSFGGEDTWLSKELVNSFGSKGIFFNSLAIAFEVIPLERLEYNWLINRSKNSGRALATIRRHSMGRGQFLYHFGVIIKSCFRICWIAFSINSRIPKLRVLLIRTELAKTIAYAKTLLSNE